MARKKIREHKAKSLLVKNLKKVANIDLAHKAVSVSEFTDFKKLEEENPWLHNHSLAVKPDMLFGQRGKSGLVVLKVNWEQAKEHLIKNLGKEVVVEGLKGKLTHFIVEPFVPHKEEYYLSIESVRHGNLIRFCVSGGIEIEDNWDKVKSMEISNDRSLDQLDLSEIISDVPENLRANLTVFLKGVYQVFEDLCFTFLEMNPFCFLEDGSFFPLDMRGELDDTALFLCWRKWEDIEFPPPFGRESTEEEKTIARIDEKSGASLKLTVLNPDGHIWLMVAGGGASVIYADTVVDLGYGLELGNYGEYSGYPNEEETYTYAKTILKLATERNDGKRKALLIGGGIANFTDIGETFKGIAKAIEERKESIEKNHLKIFVRRGGPNYKVGLNLMENLGNKLNLPIEVFGPETPLTRIVPLAINYIKHE
eukprot:TRINITY_DN6064_c0_g1_i2.p1 TRINITY_DN6064_c0_g1~~TRINITY_DN6064_c0_g1_i2.p1  ORF type:complete len:453 (-),score=109.98 TRINITY_DN6064_c0_g1_i2:44-1315(-)